MFRGFWIRLIAGTYLARERENAQLYDFIQRVLSGVDSGRTNYVLTVGDATVGQK